MICGWEYWTLEIEMELVGGREIECVGGSFKY